MSKFFYFSIPILDYSCIYNYNFHFNIIDVLLFEIIHPPDVINGLHGVISTTTATSVLKNKKFTFASIQSRGER